MAQATRQHDHRHGPLSVLNTDGRAHPVENAFAAATIVLGLVAFVTSFFAGLHILASWVGLVGVLTGLRGQMISATTAERFLLIIGLGMAAFGLYLGMANGGFFDGFFGDRHGGFSAL
ncbi:hypothetical protein GCM10023347_06040 [Streptomyces chumphonensis]|uniref:Uncharacterized protein n=1 Tax=Streptomyces chumphonensis TaxID=1214925 RepID=A0A927F2L7_9ACTN|nr:hypothetical protein [Streptomyces chumphonensis]MBD3933232.1 hypothetical protein [Streptomyces chumphonensis]